MLNIISLGAGVQSSTMALMAAHGEITPMPDCAIFADTQAEPKEVYDWLGWLEKQLPFPVYRVTNGSLTDDSLEIRRRIKDGVIYTRSLIPAFVIEEKGTGLLGRKCTADYKIKAMNKKKRELLGLSKGQRNSKFIVVKSWIGISTDEGHRQKPSGEKWSENIFPLINKNMSRGHCFEWMKKQGYPKPPRSACVYCPFHSDKEWTRIKDDMPNEFNRAVKFEKDLQAASAQDKKLRGKPFLHNSCKPLDQVHFDVNKSLDMFGNECEGMCGV